MIGALPPPQQEPQQAAPMPEMGQQGALPSGMEQQGAVQAPLSETPQGGDKGYNGVVNHSGQSIEVRNGVAKFDGQTYFVSSDGSIVINSADEVVGRVVNGMFMEIDDQYLAELRSQGLLKE